MKFIQKKIDKLIKLISSKIKVDPIKLERTFLTTAIVVLAIAIGIIGTRWYLYKPTLNTVDEVVTVDLYEIRYNESIKEVNTLREANIEFNEYASELEIQIRDMMIEVEKIRVELVEYRRLKLDAEDVTVVSNANATELDKVLSGTGLEGLGCAYVQAEKEYGINAIYLMSITALESGWATNRLSIDKNNIASINANDSNPYGDAYYFETKGDCIMALAELLSRKYIGDNGFLSLDDIGSIYAQDSKWSSKVENIGDMVFGKIKEVE